MSYQTAEDFKEVCDSLESAIDMMLKQNKVVVRALKLCIDELAKRAVTVDDLLIVHYHYWINKAQKEIEAENDAR